MQRPESGNGRALSRRAQTLLERARVVERGVVPVAIRFRDIVFLPQDPELRVVPLHLLGLDSWRVLRL